jgi:hypothetical protein
MSCSKKQVEMFSEWKNPSAARVTPVCLSPTYIFVVNRLLRKIFLPKRETGENYVMRNFMICSH